MKDWLSKPTLVNRSEESDRHPFLKEMRTIASCAPPDFHQMDRHIDPILDATECKRVESAFPASECSAYRDRGCAFGASRDSGRNRDDHCGQPCLARIRRIRTDRWRPTSTKAPITCRCATRPMAPVAEEAAAIAAGIRAVMRDQQPSFALEYPCHSPQEKRWFIARVTRFHERRPRPHCGDA